MENILGKNDIIAEENALLFSEKKLFVLNLMGSPGAGKTSLLERTLEAFKGELKLAVIEGDLFTDKDAKRIEAYGAPVIQINTSGGCHLDASMVQRVLGELTIDDLDLLIIENVGNLVCPAEFELGSDKKAVVLSITEGDDKPLKYPLMFKEADIAVLNKVDLLPFTDFDMASAKGDIEKIHPGIVIAEVSCRTSDGLDAWLDWLRREVRGKKEKACV